MISKTISELASTISSNTSSIESYLSTNGLPTLSSEAMEHEFPESIQMAQNAILEATDELQALVLGPLGILIKQTVSCFHLPSILGICPADIEIIYRTAAAT